MSEYHIVRADGSGTLVTFDKWSEEVVESWRKLGRNQSINLVCFWPCGCLRRALVAYEQLVTPQGKWTKRKYRVIKGWRVFEQCEYHILKPKERGIPSNREVRDRFRAKFPSSRILQCYRDYEPAMDNKPYTAGSPYVWQEHIFKVS